MLNTLLNVKELAQVLSVSKKSVYRMLENEQIPFYVIGGMYRFDLNDVLVELRIASKYEIEEDNDEK